MKVVGFLEEVVLLSGYEIKKDPLIGNHSYIRKINGNDFPRFHITKHKEGHYNIHCDLKRLHGRLFTKDINITTKSEQIKQELIRIEIFKHIRKIDIHKSEIKRLREKLI